MGNALKALLVHNFYQSSAPSGEDAVFQNEMALLEGNGVEVIAFTKQNDDIGRKGGRLAQASGMVWSRDTYRELSAILRREKPDLAHFHNIWYLISPSAYYACREVGVPVVQTVHNFRMFCVNGLLLRDEKICEDCLGKMPWRGLVRACFRDSFVYSLPVAASEVYHRARGTWRNLVDRYICLTEFGKQRLLAAGLPESKIAVKPNTLPDPPEWCFEHDNYAVYLGRLSPEKGLFTLLEGWRQVEEATGRTVGLKIVGDGALRPAMEARIIELGLVTVEVLGRKNHEESMEILRRSMFMVMPTLCYEMFPLTAIEAFACGKPVVASRLGAMAEIVHDGVNGFLFEAGNARDLADKATQLTGDEDAGRRMGERARRGFDERYGAGRNFAMLMTIYESVITQIGSKPI
jgi:glycosyltransferase involved in cell wall biosynthesis